MLSMRTRRGLPHVSHAGGNPCLSWPWLPWLVLSVQGRSSGRCAGPETRCSTALQHVATTTLHAPGADPAAEHFNYPVSFDIRDLVTLEDVMEEMELGPNG
jgi:hypothetical protein